jgi:hypothetical protein
MGQQDHDFMRNALSVKTLSFASPPTLIPAAATKWLPGNGSAASILRQASAAMGNDSTVKASTIKDKTSATIGRASSWQPNGTGPILPGIGSVAPSPASPAPTDKTVSIVLGEVTWLLTQSPQHKSLAIADLEWQDLQ